MEKNNLNKNLPHFSVGTDYTEFNLINLYNNDKRWLTDS